MVAISRQVNPFSKSIIIVIVLIIFALLLTIVNLTLFRQFHHLPVLYIFKFVFGHVDSVPVNTAILSDTELVNYDYVTSTSMLSILTTPSNFKYKRPKKKHRKVNRHHHHHHHHHNYRATNLSDIFISVKTTKSFHDNRLNVILKTWFNLAANETYFFTDSNDDELNNKTGKLNLMHIITHLFP